MSSHAPTPRSTGEPGIVLPCYEGPNGLSTELALSNTELGRSILLLGSTGAGKTSALRAICRGLIEQQAQEPSRKPALIVFDFKGDQQTIDLLTRWAEKSGRGADVRLLSLTSERAYDFFSGFRELSDVQEYVERLLFGCGATNSRDVFWDEYRSGMLATALVLSRVLGMPHDFPTWISGAASWLLAESVPLDVKKAFSDLEKVVAAMSPHVPDRPLAQFALATIRDWDQGLDHRTRSNVRATISNTLRPLLDPKVQHVCLRAFRFTLGRRHDSRKTAGSRCHGQHRLA